MYDDLIMDLAIYASYVLLLLFQKQEAWACVKGSSAGITASAACPLAGRWSFWESFRWDWIWVFFSPSCDI